MGELATLQEQFRRYVLGESDAVRALVSEGGRASAQERLGVYRDAYALRLIEALEADYPALAAVLGEADFTSAAHAYIAANPSRHRSIRWFGARLADFLAATQPWRARPWLGELARFEWALSLGLDAGDAPRVTFEGMGALSPEIWPVMRLRFHPSVQRLDLAWNAPALRKAIDESIPPPAAERSEVPTPWLVWREELTVQYRSLGVDEAWALDAALGGADFGALCEGLCEWIETAHVAAHAAGMLRLWVSEGLVSAVDER